MKLLLYCTKAKKQKDLLWANNLSEPFLDGRYNRIIDDLPKYLLNGKIVAECDFDVEEIKDQSWQSDATRWYSSELLEKSCLHVFEIDNYLKGKEGYAIHIKNLHIFDKPKRLYDYYQYTIKGIHIPAKNVQKAPQNMMRVFSWRGDDCILISIRPEWLCKILNGEKTIEVRKKVLKEMIK